MKTLKIFLGIAALAISSTVGFAIEGLTLSLDCTNVVLRWPSVEGETYIVQHRAALGTNDVWETLTNLYPAFTETNWTTFTHSNQVSCINTNYSSAGTNVGGDGPPPPGNYSSLSYSSLVSLNEYPPLPPLPWEQSSCSETFPASGFSANEASGGEDFGSVEIGFYRVVCTGVNLAAITNGQILSGVIRIPVEISTESPVIGLFLDESVEDAPTGTRVDWIDGGSPAFIWDTHRVLNGSYTLHPAINLQGGVVITGPEVTVIVSNVIQMPFRFDTFGGTMPILAETTIADSGYVINIKDDQGNLRRTLTGTASSATISNYWDGLDEASNVVDSEFVEASISLLQAAAAGGDGGFEIPPIVWIAWREGGGSINGQWMIAHQNIYSGVNKTAFENNMNSVVQFATDHGGVITGSRFVLPSGSTSAGQWSLFKTNLTQQSCRNLYFFGHGGPVSIGYGANDPTHGMTHYELESLLKNWWLTVTNENVPFVHVTFHPYRFVFLDGCSTGKESDWPDAFGVPDVRATDQNFADFSLPPRAIVGWKRAIYVAYGVGDSSRHTFVVNFFERWMEGGEELEAALQNAASGTIGNGSTGFPAIQIRGAYQLHAQ